MLKKFLYFFFVCGILTILSDLFILHIEYTPRRIIFVLSSTVVGGLLIAYLAHKEEKDKRNNAINSN